MRIRAPIRIPDAVHRASALAVAPCPPVAIEMIGFDDHARGKAMMRASWPSFPRLDASDRTAADSPRRRRAGGLRTVIAADSSTRADLATGRIHLR